MHRTILLLPFFLLLSAAIVAQDAPSWTPEFMMKFKSISSVEMSPDGQHVAYVVRTPVMEGEKSEYLSHIWVAHADGRDAAQYTRGDKSCTSPKFSPNGKYLAFLSSRTDKQQIWRMRLMGGEAEQITSTENGVQSFKWSHQGDRIAFLQKDADTEDEELAKKEKRYVIEVDQNYKHSHLYTLDLSASDTDEYATRQLTSGAYTVTGYDWSPDGTSIAFTHKTTPKINTSRLDGDLAVVPADSGAIRQLVTTLGIESNPKYSPDGQWIAYQSTGTQPEPIGLNDLYRIPADGGQPIAFPQTPNRSSSFIGWKANSQSIFISEAYGTVPVAMEVPLGPSTAVVKIITPEVGSSSSVSFNDATDKMAYVYQTMDQPAELYVASTSGSASPKAITAVNSTIELPEMGKTEVIQWISKDGLQIEGILTYPVGYEKGKKYPVILQIHGGPAGVFTQTFTGNPSIYHNQAFAEQGYIVIRPNPRGSTGYGKEFRYANFQDWGYGDYEDVMSGVDKVIDMGIGDENKMAVMGWSYGGYLTSFLVTRTDRFKAASMGAGLPNLISMTSTTDIPDYLVGHMGGEFWDDYDRYEKHSAMYHIKKVSTPTQVIHGANDLRVPFTQGQEFYVALDRRGIDTEMLVLPRTPHGPREPKLLMEVSPRIMKWFDQYIWPKP